ncbi:MAG: S1 RNA-binding domain-containing protein, partial [Bacteroidales bacterium]|nr:S1 RNA-binding domain-containing protein [Bacteroidales bacterium]
EDHLGDMDFKVTGTSNGITATQMDIKVDGLSYEILAKALDQANKGRMHILGKITETIEAPRQNLKPHAPRIVQIVIPKEMIGAIIGTGGKIIQEIQSVTGTTIVIEEVDNKGVVDIFAENQDSIEAALKRINSIIEIPEAGKVYSGKVKSITAFGAFVEIMPGKEGLLHISEVEWRHLQSLEGILKEGDEVEVKLLEVDKKQENSSFPGRLFYPVLRELSNRIVLKEETDPNGMTGMTGPNGMIVRTDQDIITNKKTSEQFGGFLY